MVVQVRMQFGRKIEETSLFLFCRRHADHIKAVHLDSGGYILYHISNVYNSRQIRVPTLSKG